MKSSFRSIAKARRSIHKGGLQITYCGLPPCPGLASFGATFTFLNIGNILNANKGQFRMLQGHGGKALLFLGGHQRIEDPRFSIIEPLMIFSIRRSHECARSVFYAREVTREPSAIGRRVKFNDLKADYGYKSEVQTTYGCGNTQRQRQLSDPN